jgi:hypothetical protein
VRQGKIQLIWVASVKFVAAPQNKMQSVWVGFVGKF